MKLISLLLFSLLNFNWLFSQSVRSIRVKAGEDVAQAYSPQGFYSFPQFYDATLYFKGGGQNKGTKFNYNILSGNLQFIGPKGDTLDMGNTATLDSAVFEKDVLCFRDGFMQVVAGADSVKLLKKIVLKTQVENIGAYGVPNSTSSIVNIRTFSNGTGVYNLVLSQDVVIVENVSWFFESNGNSLVKANKDNLLKLLSGEKQSKAAAYLKQNKTSFDKETDLKKLMAAIGS